MRQTDSARLPNKQYRKLIADLRFGPLSIARANFEVDMADKPDWAWRNGWNARHLASIGQIILDAEEALERHARTLHA